MSESILNISHLNARVEEKEILHNINLQINKGETHVLMGPNGAGKSTLGYVLMGNLGYVLMGNPRYEVTDGTISSKGVKEYQKDRDGALLIITHSTRILESLHVDYAHVMVNGHIVATGDGSMVDRINKEGYESFVAEP